MIIATFAFSYPAYQAIRQASQLHACRTGVRFNALAHTTPAAPQAVQTALPLCGTFGKQSSVELGSSLSRTHLVFPWQPSECLAIHSAACCSVVKPLTTSVSPSGQRTSTTQPNPGLPFRATKAGRYSDISRICAYGAPVQAGRLATIKLIETCGRRQCCTCESRS